jgi:predicted Rossmann fold flavoprotein
MLFTHFGVSGPLVLSASAHMPSLGGSERYRLSLDLKPGLDERKLDGRLLKDFGRYSNKEFKNALDDLFPQKLIPVLVSLSGIPEETKVNLLTREQRHRLAGFIKDFPLSVLGARPIEEAIVTAGGVEVGEVNPRTMESLLLKGLYFAGEILDVDAYTGGFNLQIAWSTGVYGGNSIPMEDENA